MYIYSYIILNLGPSIRWNTISVVFLHFMTNKIRIILNSI